MMFWIILGLCLIIPSLAMLIIRYRRGDAHKDTYLSSLFGWPTVVSGILMMIPTFIWYDFAVGFIAMAAYEGWQFLAVKRKHAEHELAVATKTKKGEAA